MRIIVFSDSHGRSDVLVDIMRFHPSAAYYLHLGDGEADARRLIKMFPYKKIIHICGNCDLASTSDQQLFMKLARGYKLFAAHGHNFGVKFSLSAIKAEARKKGADILLFGHTHEPVSFYEDGMHIMNPGAAMNRRYGIIDITPSGVMANNALLPGLNF